VHDTPRHAEPRARARPGVGAHAPSPGRRVTPAYHDGSRALQERFDTVRLADRIEERNLSDAMIDEEDRAFIEAADMFFLATADAEGRPQCSYKGGEPGFVRVLDARTIAFPSWDGNGMYLSAGNVLVNPHVGLLFIDFERRSRMRLNGIASIDHADPLLAEYPKAEFVVRVATTQVFPNCPRYIHRYQLVERSPFVPRDGCRTPAPVWKTRDWSRDVLPAGDPALDPSTDVV
jgi:predicted pyridoxine 5'-phosphate oxidase superfamily flavin-nucleotide-binding protein